MNPLTDILNPVRHGLAFGLLALIFGALWAGYMATHHETLHGAFEAQLETIKQTQTKHLMSEMNMEAMNLPSAHAAQHNHNHAANNDNNNNTDHDSHAGNGQHSHSGNLAKDAMQRLLRGHIHFMGIGLLAIIMLILVASSSLKSCWKHVFGWTFGLGALAYPPAWILMGFRTVELGPEAAEASVLWLFGPAVGLLLGSLIALFVVMIIEALKLHHSNLLAWAFQEKVA